MSAQRHRVGSASSQAQSRPPAPRSRCLSRLLLISALALVGLCALPAIAGASHAYISSELDLSVSARAKQNAKKLKLRVGCGDEITCTVNIRGKAKISKKGHGNNPGPLPSQLTSLGDVFSKHAAVFGIDIVGTEATPDAAIRHAASILAEYLDNNGDGQPDDPAVVQAMRENNALLIMGVDEQEGTSLHGSDILDGFSAQDLYATETNPSEGFDAALEEVHHLIATQGWAQVYPELFLPERGSRLANAMDKARGGQFAQVPATYPEGSWYHYDDTTCDYSCMAVEYFYWAHTTLLGAQAERCGEIANEWEPCTPDKLRETDLAITRLLATPGLNLPMTLPDGSHQITKDFKLKPKTIKLKSGESKKVTLKFKKQKKAVQKIAKLQKGSKKARKSSKVVIHLTATSALGVSTTSKVKIKLEP